MMIKGYLAVGNKCALDFAQLQLPISQTRAMEILWRKGFRVVNVDVVVQARACVGKANYRRGANISDAPYVMDCSTLTKWAFAKIGIWLPRHSIDQRELGLQVKRSEVTGGDLIFMSGRRSYWHQEESVEVGHVGICTDDGTVIHACNSSRGVVEDQMDQFLREGTYCGCRRIKTPTTITFESPSNRIVECSWEFRQILHPDIFPEHVGFPEVCHPFE